MRHQRMRGWVDKKAGRKMAYDRAVDVWGTREYPAKVRKISLQAVLQDLEEGEEGRAQGVGVAQNQPAKLC